MVQTRALSQAAKRSNKRINFDDEDYVDVPRSDSESDASSTVSRPAKRRAANLRPGVTYAAAADPSNANSNAAVAPVKSLTEVQPTASATTIFAAAAPIAATSTTTAAAITAASASITDARSNTVAAVAAAIDAVQPSRWSAVESVVTATSATSTAFPASTDARSYAAVAAAATAAIADLPPSPFKAVVAKVTAAAAAATTITTTTSAAHLLPSTAPSSAVAIFPGPPCSSTPEPLSTEPDPTGAISGTLPYVVPRRVAGTQATVVIVERSDGITTYEIRNKNGEVSCCRIDTRNEFLLLGAAISIQRGRVCIGNRQRLACVVAAQSPSPDPENRHIVDHKNRVTTDDFAANLCWVSYAFNSFNRTRSPTVSGFHGVRKRGGDRWYTKFGQNLTTMPNIESAARLYDLLCSLRYGDQLDRVEGVLNQLPDQARHVICEQVRADGVEVWRVEHTFVVIKREAEDCKAIGDTHTSRTAAIEVATTTAMLQPNNKMTGMSRTAAKPSAAQQPISPVPVVMNEVVIDKAAKIEIPSKKTGLLPKASAMPPAMSSSAPLTSENIDIGHDIDSCGRLTDLAMDGNAMVSPPFKKVVRMVTPQIEVRLSTVRVVEDSFGGVKTLESFLDESALRRSSDKLILSLLRKLVLLKEIGNGGTASMRKESYILGCQVLVDKGTTRFSDKYRIKNSGRSIHLKYPWTAELAQRTWTLASSSPRLIGRYPPSQSVG